MARNEAKRKRAGWLTEREEHRMFAASYRGISHESIADIGAEILLLLGRIIHDAERLDAKDIQSNAKRIVKHLRKLDPQA